MTEIPTLQPAEAAPAQPLNTWQRVKERKVVQWTLAYIALAYGLLHGVELVGHAFEWPVVVPRMATLVLALGVPVAALLAWYHGDRAQHRVSGTELTILSVLFLVGGTVLWMLARNDTGTLTGDHDQPAQFGTIIHDDVDADGCSPCIDRGRTVRESHRRTRQGVLQRWHGRRADQHAGRGAGSQSTRTDSSFAYKDRNMDVRQIAHDLGVGAVLEGSVRSAGERIRVTAQLVDGNTGYHLWSQSYDRKFTDLFNSEDAGNCNRAGTQGAHACRVAVDGESGAADPDLEAYELYLQARLVDRPTRQCGRICAQPENCCESDGARSTIRARVLFNWAYAPHFFGSGLSVDPQELVKAEQAARHALSLDPDLVESRAILARVNADRGNWLAARRDFQAALSLNTEDPASTPASRYFY